VKKSDEEDRTLVQKMGRFWEDSMLLISYIERKLKIMMPNSFAENKETPPHHIIYHSYHPYIC
jgi:hypothetical protein